jgi:choline kinase
VTYSDIFVEPSVHRRLADTPGDIVLAVDRDWSDYYAGRDAHPMAEAEKVVVDPAPDATMGTVRAIGKKLDTVTEGSAILGEFLGLWKMTAAGARQFRDRFDTLDRQLPADAPFREAAQWRRAYITDLLMDLIHAGTDVRCLLIERGWAEFDVAEDYERLPATIHRQRLTSLGSSS